MPYKDPEQKRRNNLEYKAARRALLTEQEKQRRARKLAEDPEGFRTKEREQSRNRHARRKDDPIYRKQHNEYAKKRYHEKLRDDPAFKAMNRAKTRAWAAANKERSKAAILDWRREQMSGNTNFRIAVLLRKRLNAAFKKAKLSERRGGRAIRLLGCTINEFRLWLEAQFQSGMTWETYGNLGWHIDHIKPLASFDLTDPEALKAACHYTNLRPLWWEENVRRHYLEAA